jgi:hypothetical protein
MKINRIAILAILAIFTVVLAGSASAFDLGFLGGSDSEPQQVTVGGIDFSIPAGFTENEDYRMENESSSAGDDFYMSAAGFEDDSKQNAIYIMVADYGDYNVTDDIIAYVADSMDGEKKTINGHTGYVAKQTSAESDSSMLDVDDDVYVFIYEQDGDLVFIGATDQAYFDDVVVV